MANRPDFIARLLQRKPIAADEKTGLRRTLGLPAVIALGIGAIVGAGLFSLTGIAAADYAGPAVVLSLLLAAIVCGLTGLCYGEMAAMIPSAGSAYAYTYASLGQGMAWIIGWDLLLEYAVAGGTVAVSWSSYLQSLLHGFGVDLPRSIAKAPAEGGLIDLPAACIVALLTCLLLLGVRESALVNVVIVVIKLGVIAMLVGLGAFYIEARNYHPFIPDNTGQFGHFGWSGVLRGAGIVFFAYLGFDAVTTTAAETENPERAMPIGIIGALGICTALYIAFAVVLTGVVNYGQMHGDAAPVATAIDRMPYAWLQIVVKVGIILGFTSVILVGLLGQGRIMFAMAQDRMLPAIFGRLHAGRQTPWMAHLVMMVMCGLLAGFVPVEALGKMTSVGTLLAFAIVCGAVLVLRIREPDRPRPFRVPGSPLTPLLGIASCLLMILSLPWETWLRLAVWFALGSLVYGLYSGRRASAALAESGRPYTTRRSS